MIVIRVSQSRIRGVVARFYPGVGSPIDLKAGETSNRAVGKNPVKVGVKVLHDEVVVRVDNKTRKRLTAVTREQDGTELDDLIEPGKTLTVRGSGTIATVRT